MFINTYFGMMTKGVKGQQFLEPSAPGLSSHALQLILYFHLLTPKMLKH